MDSIVEQFYTQTSESIKLIFDLTSRIDERIGKLIEKQEGISSRLNILENNTDWQKLEKYADLIQQALHRITMIESKNSTSNDDISDLEIEMQGFKQRIQGLEIKIEAISIKTLQHENRWTQIFDLIFKIALMLIGGFLLYKLGWSSPPS